MSKYLTENSGLRSVSECAEIMNVVPATISMTFRGVMRKIAVAVAAHHGYANPTEAELQALYSSELFVEMVAEALHHPAGLPFVKKKRYGVNKPRNPNAKKPYADSPTFYCDICNRKLVISRHINHTEKCLLWRAAHPISTGRSKTYIKRKS